MEGIELVSNIRKKWRKWSSTTTAWPKTWPNSNCHQVLKLKYSGVGMVAECNVDMTDELGLLYLSRLRRNFFMNNFRCVLKTTLTTVEDFPKQGIVCFRFQSICTGRGVLPRSPRSGENQLEAIKGSG